MKDYKLGQVYLGYRSKYRTIVKILSVSDGDYIYFRTSDSMPFSLLDGNTNQTYRVHTKEKVAIDRMFSENMLIKQLSLETPRKDRILIQYLKNYREKNGRTVGIPCGCMVAVRKDANVFFGWSKYDCKREQSAFSKEKARMIAINRARKGRKYDIRDLPFAIQEKFSEFTERAERFFGEEPVNFSR